MREAEESNTRSKRERVDEDDEEMDIDDDDDDDDEAGPTAPTASDSTSCIMFYCIQLIVVFDHPFSTSAAFQQAALFKPPAGGHKWCFGSIISTVRIDDSYHFIIHI